MRKCKWCSKELVYKYERCSVECARAHILFALTGEKPKKQKEPELRNYLLDA